MYHRIKSLIPALLVLLLQIPVMAKAQESEPAMSAEYKDGVYMGSTSTYRTDSTLAVDKGVMAVSEPDNRVLTQKEKADRLARQDKYGLSLSIMSMCTVVLALAVLSCLFLIFGRISSAMQRKRKQQAHGPVEIVSHEDVQDDSGEVIAAITAAIAEHFSGKHDMEDYILTIRSMKRSYSPWNSKIYNLRHMPQVHHH